MSADLSYAMTLDPKKAVEYLAATGVKVPKLWNKIYDEQKKNAADVAEYIKLNVLQSTADQVKRAIKEGMTKEQFRKELTDKLTKAGWYGKADGEEILTPYRIDLIYRTQVQGALQAGRYKEQMDGRRSRPYLQYVAILDSRTRPGHKELHNIVLPADDPFWATNYPPNGFNCRCRVRALSEKNVRDRGLTVAKGSDIDFKADPGWGRNPAKQVFEPDLKQYETPIAEQYRKAVS